MATIGCFLWVKSGVADRGGRSAKQGYASPQPQRGDIGRPPIEAEFARSAQ
jgi:hypothetical protein